MVSKWMGIQYVNRGRFRLHKIIAEHKIIELPAGIDFCKYKN